MKTKKEKKLTLSVPALVKEHCFVGHKEVLPDENISAFVYLWCGTDRTSIVWKKGNKVIGRMEMHWMELFASFKECLQELQYLTLEMEVNGWGVMDLRNLTAVRKF